MNGIPSAYIEGHTRAAAIDNRLADIYVRHTRIGDPLADAAVEDLASLSRKQASRFIKAGMNQDEGVLRNAPKSLRNVFAEPEPPWLDHEAFRPGARAFMNNVVNVFAAFVAGTLISESRRFPRRAHRRPFTIRSTWTSGRGSASGNSVRPCRKRISAGAG